MGYDLGVLIDAESPSLPYREGYVDWGGDNWRRGTDPKSWMKLSVVWYSQQIAHTLGEDRLRAYATEFGYGNFSGAPGRCNGLDRSWIDSSLKISPLEQVEFLRRLVCRSLPVSGRAVDMTKGIVERGMNWREAEDRRAAGGRRDLGRRPCLGVVRRLGRQGRLSVRVRPPYAGRARRSPFGRDTGSGGPAKGLARPAGRAGRPRPAEVG